MDFSFCFSTLLPVPKIVFKCAAQRVTTKHTPPVQAPPKTAFPRVQSAFLRQHHIEIPRDRPITLETCEHLISDMIKTRELSIFRRKVSETDINYYKVIKTPMDFETIKERLLNGTITSVTQFKDNLDLIWSNCRTFNGDYSDLTKLANDVQREIDDLWNAAMRNNKRSVDDVGESVARLNKLDGLLDDIQCDFEKLMDKEMLNTLKQRPVLSKLRDDIQKKKQKQNVNNSTNNLPPNLKQLKEMADKISSTPPGQLKEVWEILKPILIEKSLNTKDEFHSFSLNELPSDVLICLKKLLIV